MRPQRRVTLLVERLEEREVLTHILGLPHPPPVDVPDITVPPIPTLADLSEQAWGEAGRHLYPAGAATMRVRNANRVVQTISRFDRTVLRQYFGDLVDRVNVYYGADPLNEWSGSGFTVYLGGEAANAQTYGYNLYVRYAKEDLSDSMRLDILAHELVHAQQYERFGKSLSNFGYHYFVEYKRAGLNYYYNKLEQEAYDFVSSNLAPILRDYESISNPPRFCLVGMSGTVSIENLTSRKLNYSLRWSASGQWKSYSVAAKGTRKHWTDTGCGEISRSPEIKFDYDFKTGYQERRYDLEYADLPTGPNGPSSAGVKFYFNGIKNGVELYRNNGAVSFAKLPGSANDIGVGGDGTAWVIGTDKQPDGFGIYRWSGSGWTKFTGSGVRIAVDPNGRPWIINNKGHIWYRNAANDGWTRTPGSATDIGIGGDGSVWVIGTDKQADGNGNGIYRWNGSGWTKLAGSGLRIAVDASGRAWVVNNKKQIWYRNAANNGWVKAPGSANDIAIGGDGSVWVVGTDKQVGGYGIHRWTGNGWVRTNGGAVGISVGPSGMPWVVNSSRAIYRGS